MAGALLTEKGFVLNRRKVGEADVILTLLRENGPIVRVKVHGILQSRKRSNLLTEPGCYISATYYHKEDAPGSLKEGHVIERFEELKSGYDDMLLLSYLLELTGASAGGEDTHDLFVLLRGCLRELQSLSAADKRTTRDIRLLLGFFKVRLCKILGILGDPGHCSECGAELNGPASWSLPEMNFLCENCSVNADEIEGGLSGLVRLAGDYRFANFLKRLPELPAATKVTHEDALTRWDDALGQCLEEFFGAPLQSATAFYGRLNREAK